MEGMRKLAIKVLLFGDIGIDDIMALIYAYLTDEIEVVGIVTEYGNITRDNALRTVQYLGEEVLVTDAPDQAVTIAGAEKSMTSVPVDIVPEIHGEFGLGPIIPPANQEEVTLENFFTIVDIIEEYGEDLHIVSVGRLTSLATMYLLYPRTMEQIKHIYVMGGAFWIPGNVTAVSEANFHGDPVAAQIVLTYAEKVTIIPLNVTQHAIVTPSMVDYIDQVGSIDIIKPMMDYYYNFYIQRDPSLQGSPLHDVLTMMAVTMNEMFTFEEYPVQIVQAATGTERGQSIADIRTLGHLEPGEDMDIKRHRIAFDFNYRDFFMKFMTVMSGERFDVKN